MVKNPQGNSSNIVISRVNLQKYNCSTSIRFLKQTEYDVFSFHESSPYLHLKWINYMGAGQMPAIVRSISARRKFLSLPVRALDHQMKLVGLASILPGAILETRSQVHKLYIITIMRHSLKKGNSPLMILQKSTST